MLKIENVVVYNDVLHLISFNEESKKSNIKIEKGRKVLFDIQPSNCHVFSS